MARLLALALIALAAALGPSGAARAAEVEEPEAQSWPHSGPFGSYDRGALQRGLQVYSEVCAGCHGLRLIAFRNLIDIGYSEDQAEAYAAQFEVAAEPDAEGEVGVRPARLADYFVSPFANENQARASNNGALPPDLSLIIKARGGGEDYLHALLTGYREPPEGVELGEGMEYNPFFPGLQIAMPAPLSEDAVEYQDGTPATVEQMARDVAQFLAWASEPMMEARKRMGVKVMLFLFALTALLYGVKRKVWSDLH